MADMEMRGEREVRQADAEGDAVLVLALSPKDNGSSDVAVAAAVTEERQLEPELNAALAAGCETLDDADEAEKAEEAEGGRARERGAKAKGRGEVAGDVEGCWRKEGGAAPKEWRNTELRGTEGSGGAQTCGRSSQEEEEEAAAAGEEGEEVEKRGGMGRDGGGEERR